MRRLRLVVGGFLPLLAGAAAAIVTAAPRSTGAVNAAAAAVCGVGRWPVKTLADPAAPRVRLRPKWTTVRALRNVPVRTGVFGERGLGAERTTYRVRVRLVALKAEADSDIHLVIADRKTGGTMIAEFPASSCTHGALRGTRARMQKARVALVRACGFPSSSTFRRVRGSGVVTGVGFFDFAHGQYGRAPNELELHPVLAFSGRC